MVQQPEEQQGHGDPLAAGQSAQGTGHAQHFYSASIVISQS